tara:strand:+ start:590 stop:1300 length:711 start_codon:yes stop_codon:yes gene_type:complete
MAVPFIYLALGAGKAIYKLANTPAGKEALKKFMSKKNPYGIKQIKPSDLPKNIQDGTKVPNTLTQSILKQKDPGIATKVANFFSRQKNRVTRKTEGVEKPGTGAEPVGKLRTKQKKKGRTIITTGITAPTSAAITYASSKSRKKDKPKRKPSAELLDRKNITTARPKPKLKKSLTKSQKDKIRGTFRTITVQKGDNITKISKRAGVSIETLKKLNPEVRKDPDFIRTGQKLRIGGK